MKQSFQNVRHFQMAVLALTFGVLAACHQPNNPELTGVREVYVPPQRPVYPNIAQNPKPAAPKGKETYKQVANLLGQKSVPMDILFVVDTSASMCSDQSNLAKNINRFVEQFLKNDKIDFHIGVTVTWDSRLYGNAPRKFKNGELRPVHGQGENVRFLTPKTPDLKNSLAKTLYVGFEAYDPKSPSTTGPENEELFSPILAALSDSMSTGPNKGFRRPEAHLAVVIVTDTEDGTPDLVDPSKNMPAAYVAEELKSKVRGDATVTVLAALARLDEMLQFKAGKEPGLTSFAKKFQNGSLARCEDYTVDPSLVEPYKGPEQINDLVTMLQGSSFDLRTNDFGGKMAGLGRTLLNKAIQYKITLDKAPDVSEPMTVKINGKIIARDDLKTWRYVPTEQTIVLSEALNLGGFDEFQVEVDYTVLN